ncbi:hypothetical protein ACHQM5_005931 [Ranunculus cassubicifolius]
MSTAAKVGNWTFKAFTAGLGLTTIYLTATFSLNVYNGISWHKQQQSKHHEEKRQSEN